MPSEQFTFRKGHSAVDQNLYFTQCVRYSQNHKPTRHTMVAFLDVSKAFDRVWKYKLLSKCFGVFGIKVEKYVNPSQIGLFADDVVLRCSDANINKMESQLNRSLVNIQEFADNHKITFNASKSTVSLFTTNRHLYNYSSEIFLMSERLNYSKYPTYLGFTLDSEVNCGKHIEKIADKAKNRLKILKYLSGSDWGSDASTLRITYTTLVCPILEYGYQILQVASSTNLKKLERVQLSAARIITGLRYSCLTDIVLYEADIQPLTMRFEVNSYRQLALEVINDIPDQALIVDTDGSRSDTGRAGSGIFSNTHGNDVKNSIMNPDHCSVFRSELIAISGALDHALNSYKDSI
ncbi:putative RNA-directed DNA polymerase from transposon BS [Trichonephila clavipes]|nr:putative RNA-directed DNA polymerase from transposon BS [Trichonephila clavipes]